MIKRLTLAILFLFIPLALSAQNLNVLNLSKLTFGDDIFPGSSKEITREEASAASFEISGEAEKEVHVTFELPLHLTNNSSENLEVTFSSDDGGYHSSETEQANATAFDPANGLIATLDSDGTLYLWLGGAVYPYSNQPGGYYSADITANVSYTN